jgi:secreted trypsin-like serine protease
VQGDSGGPLAVQEEQDGFYSVVGIISFGSPEGCGNNMLPDVSTRVTFYLKWIYLVLTEA